jgi:acid stress-induced BolA-like protein IbaG/YrbA
MAQAIVFDYQQTAKAATAALKEAFPDSVIHTDKGFEGRVHMKIISPAFDGLSERKKQAKVWDVLKARLGPDDVVAISMVVVYGMDELP